MERALRCARFQPSGVSQKHGTKSRACFLCLPSPSGSGSQELDGRALPGCGAPSALRVPSPSRVPSCSVVGDAVLGAEPAPFPSPLPPASSGAGPVHSLRALLWTCSDPLSCERLAVCSGRLIFSLSLAIPQFKLVTHKSFLRLSSGHSGPVLTLSNAAHFSLFRPHLLVADAGVWGYFSAESCF